MARWLTRTNNHKKGDLMELVSLLWISVGAVLLALIGSCFIPEDSIGEFFSGYNELIVDKLFQLSKSIFFFSISAALVATVILPVLEATEIAPSTLIIMLLVYISLRKH